MAVEFFTGFEGCGNTADARSLFSHYHASHGEMYSRFYYQPTGGFDNGKCFQIGKSTTVALNYYIARYCTPAKTIVIGKHMINFPGFAFVDEAHARGSVFYTLGQFLSVWITDGQVRVYRGNVMIASGNVTWSTSIHHIEVKLVSHASEGYVGVKVDGTLIIDEANLNTGGADFTGIRLPCAHSSAHQWRIDNIFIADNWQGELKSHLILPTADDAVQFTPSAGADNYALLQTNDGDTSYVSSDVIDEQDLYEFGPDLGMFEVHAVSIVAVARKDDVGVRNLQTVVEYDDIAYDLESFNLPTSYPSVAGSAQMQCLSEAPNAAAWSPILINAMKAGFKVA